LHRRDHLNLRLRHRTSPRISPMTSLSNSRPQGGPHRERTAYRQCHGNNAVREGSAGKAARAWRIGGPAVAGFAAQNAQSPARLSSYGRPANNRKRCPLPNNSISRRQSAWVKLRKRRITQGNKVLTELRRALLVELQYDLAAIQLDTAYT
jgi:hypothetical protein